MRLLPIVFALLSVTAQAEEDVFAPVREQLQTCISCHGEGGASANPEYPILGGQEFYYLYVQLKDYKSGLRDNPIMGPMAAGLDKAEMKLLAQYFSEQPWPSVDYQVTPEQQQIALSSISAGQCVACHLSGFEGNSRVPRAAGQHPQYLELTMRNFKSKARNNSPSKSSLMGSMTDQEIVGLAAYLAAMGSN